MQFLCFKNCKLPEKLGKSLLSTPHDFAGTSTGALIALGLVGGNEKDEKRVPLTTEEIVQLYKDMIPKIFKKAKANRGYSWLASWFKETPLIPYTQEVMMEELHKMYGDIKTSEIGDKDSCIAGRLYFFDFFYHLFVVRNCALWNKPSC